MTEKLEIYNKINNKNYLRFELNESNEKEYFNKLISVRDALIEVEKNNNESYYNKISKLENLKEDIKNYYNYYQDACCAELDIRNVFEEYENNYIIPIDKLAVRKEKLQLQVVPYKTNGIWQRFKAFFSYEGRAKLKIEKEFNKELKNIDKEIKELENVKKGNPLNFTNLEDKIYKDILENVDYDIVNNGILTEEERKEVKASIKISKDIVIKNAKKEFLNKISEYVEVCSDYSEISDLNVEEHFKFKNTEYKLYLQDGYFDNDYNSVVKYLELAKSENDFIGKQAAKKLIDGIQECIEDLEKLINQDDSSLKLA